MDQQKPIDFGNNFFLIMWGIMSISSLVLAIVRTSQGKSPMPYIIAMWLAAIGVRIEVMYKKLLENKEKKNGT